MKWEIRPLAVLLCVVALMACAVPAEAPEMEEPTPEETAEETREITPQLDEQDMAAAAYSQILESLGTLPPNSSGYPEEFGDAYYEDGYLCVCLTENSLEMRKKYCAMVDTPEILKFVEVTYSYNELCALKEAIVEMEGLVWSMVGVDVEENRVDVGIPDISKEAETLEQIIETLPMDVAELFSECPITVWEVSVVEFT